MNVKRMFVSLSVESRIQITRELKARGDNVQRLMRILDNINQRYGVENKGLRSGGVRGLSKGEQRTSIGGEPLPFDLYSEEPRTGGTCTVYKIKMGANTYAMKRLNAEVSLEAFRREGSLLKDLPAHSHITDVFGSVIDMSNRPNIIFSSWCQASRNLENE